MLIPAFSIGRTQELLYEFESILHELKKNPRSFASKLAPTGWGDIAIIVDSPLAAKFTEVYKELKSFWDEEALQRVRAGRHPLDFESLITVDSHEDHERLVRHLAETKRPAIVLAASGMAAGGRIVNYLKAMIDNPVHCVLFVGYQAPGTPGHTIAKHANSAGASVELDGESYPIRAMVASIGGYSAHADQANLVSFVRNMRKWPQQIRIVHGNDEARAELREKFLMLAKQKGMEIEILLPKRESH